MTEKVAPKTAQEQTAPPEEPKEEGAQTPPEDPETISSLAALAAQIEQVAGPVREGVVLYPGSVGKRLPDGRVVLSDHIDFDAGERPVNDKYPAQAV